MGLGAGLREAAASTDSERAPEDYRRSLGLPWLIALVLIPLLIAAIGYGASHRARSAAGPSGAQPTSAPSGKPGAPKLSLAPLSITRNGNEFVLSGEFPDDSAKGALIKALNGSLTPDVTIIDQIRINPNVDALDFSKAGPIFKDSASILDFALTVSGDTITVTGTAATQDQKNTVEQEATRTWSNLNVVGKLAVNVPVPPIGLPAPASCASLAEAITALTGGPITFANDGFSMTPVANQILSEVADKLKACPTAHAAINGYTDNSGTEAINISLSNQRAQTVANFLIAHGVAGSQLEVKGLGSVNPVAPNDTPEGRAKNRRVEIVVS
ncbi:channel-forming protein ArfA/OmpATb [Mycobacterium palustre]|uniref:OmpA-like domain-containing protein n=1 Tax=Mycobacterium palustre TaxID=153971 RepID=A0A1X1ZLS8_9MYCO|nr:OmpA family protein [Mycobacterium palustre]MCV7102291.1 OmpA family protein [Mycobacterium palustre]ORW24316.1 hypothetical protein AWC19_09345 [Mycobacterium palustre]